MEPTTIAAINDLNSHHAESSEGTYADSNFVFVYICVFCNEQFYSNNLFVKHLSNKHFVEIEVQKKKLGHPIEYSEDETQNYEWDKRSDSLIRYSPEIIFNINEGHPEDTTLFELNATVLESENSHESNKTDDGKHENHIPLENDSSPTKNNDFSSLFTPKTNYECVHCRKQYKSKTSLKNHRKAHENIEKIKCHHISCSKTFTSSSGYFHHMRTHTEKNPFQCQYCAKGFYQKCNMQVHIRRCHTLDKPYKCQYCEKAFASSTDRQIHQRLHTGEKPFFCDLCGKEFITASKMSYHRKLHFEVKKYCCKKCDEKYSTRSLLYKHSLDHAMEKTFDCDVCGKRCRRRQTLMVHKKLHSEE